MYGQRLGLYHQSVSGIVAQHDQRALRIVQIRQAHGLGAIVRGSGDVVTDTPLVRGAGDIPAVSPSPSAIPLRPSLSLIMKMSRVIP